MTLLVFITLDRGEFSKTIMALRIEPFYHTDGKVDIFREIRTESSETHV